MTANTFYKIYIDRLTEIYSKREAENIAAIVFEEYIQTTKTQRLINDFELNELQLSNINNTLSQLLQHKPLQQILGYAWFYYNKFLVDENVLIPRPETEELVDAIIKENKHLQNLNVLEVGTGTGCIAISLKNNLENVHVTAIDISKEALQIATKNATQLNSNIHFLQQNFLDEHTWKSLSSFDVIVSNPPYITFEEKEEMKKNVLNYEPHIALFTPNNDALIFYKKIAAFALTHLNTNGKIYCEINETLYYETAEGFINKGFKVNILKDMQGKNRMLKASL